MGIFDVVDDATKALLIGKSLLSGSGHNRYHLTISGCNSDIDIQSFEGTECLSSPFAYQINFTSLDPNITPQDVLNCTAKFFFQSPSDLEPQRRVYGVITGFSKLSSSKDQTTYAVTLEPRLALLRKTQYTSIFQNQSIPQIVEKVLRDRHGFEGQDFHFDLTHSYPAHEQDMQYKETDYEFIARKLAWDGIWYRFDMDTRLELDVVVFSDDQSKYVFGNSLPVRNPAGSGMNDNAILSVWGLKVQHNVVQAGAKVKDYNYRTANATQNSETDSWQPDNTTYGVPYHYGDRYLERGTDIDPDIETGSFHARLHNERYKNEKVRIYGTTNDPSLYPGKVLDLEGGSTDPALKDGFLIVSTTNKGSRNGKYEMSFEAIPYNDQVGFRPKLLDRPHIAGTIPARVSSTEKFDTYSHIDEMGRYKIYFDFDLDTWDKGKESLWVRLAKPYSGGTYGFHWPLLDGTEVAIAFEDGDPDRPYIAYALHDSSNGDHVTIQNYKRNVLRTPSNNKMRMEDERGKEHIKLSTEYGGKTQLNMGHLVDSSRQKRGEGFELRTDKWGAIRANNGIFISADGRQKASSTSLDMIEATGQLSSALNQAKQLREAANASKATGLDTSNLMTLIESAITMLQQASVLISAPAGIAQTTPSTIQHNAGQNVITTAGKDVSLNAKNNVTTAASQEVSLFAHNKDLRAVAGYGKVELQAQTNVMNLDAKQDIQITSHDGKLTLYSPTEINFVCGKNSFIHMNPDQVIINAPDQIIERTAVVMKQSVGSMPLNIPPLPIPAKRKNLQFQFTDYNGSPHAKVPYTTTFTDGTVGYGITDDQGYTEKLYSNSADQLDTHLLFDQRDNDGELFIGDDLQNVASDQVDQFSPQMLKGKQDDSEKEKELNNVKSKIENPCLSLKDAKQTLFYSSAEIMAQLTTEDKQTLFEKINLYDWKNDWGLDQWKFNKIQALKIYNDFYQNGKDEEAYKNARKAELTDLTELTDLKGKKTINNFVATRIELLKLLMSKEEIERSTYALAVVNKENQKELLMSKAGPQPSSGIDEKYLDALGVSIVENTNNITYDQYLRPTDAEQKLKKFIEIQKSQPKLLSIGATRPMCYQCQKHFPQEIQDGKVATNLDKQFTKTLQGNESDAQKKEKWKTHVDALKQKKIKKGSGRGGNR